MDSTKYIPITNEQFNLLSNALRTRIMHVLKHRSRTAKQVAESLDESAGNVHYHVQKLYRGGLLDLVETKEVGGIVEKYYRAKGTRFELKGSVEPLQVDGDTRSRLFSTFKIPTSEIDGFIDDLASLLNEWEGKISDSDSVEVVFDASVAIRKEKDGSET